MLYSLVFPDDLHMFFPQSHYNANRRGRHIEKGGYRFSGTLNLRGAPGHSLPPPPPPQHWKLENIKSITAVRDLIPTLKRREGLICSMLPVLKCVAQVDQDPTPTPNPTSSLSLTRSQQLVQLPLLLVVVEGAEWVE